MVAMPRWLKFRFACLGLCSFAACASVWAHRVDPALSPVWDVAFSPDGKLLAAGSGTQDMTAIFRHGAGAVRIWEVAGWKQYASFSEGFTSDVRGVAFSPDGKVLAAGSDCYNLKTRGNPFAGHWVRFWDVAQREERPPLRLKEDGGFILHLAYSPAGDRLAIGRTGQASLLVDVTNNVIAFPFELSTNSEDLAYSPDGKTLVGCYPPFPEMRLYRAEDGKVLASQSRGTRPPRYETFGKETPHGVPVSARFSPDGKLIAAGCDDGVVYLFDAGLEQEAGKLKVVGPARALAFSPEGRLLAVTGSESIYLFDTQTRKPAGTLDERSGKINAVTFSPGGKLLAAAGRSVRVWDVATGKLVKDLK